jgi:hypothetical protein
MNERVRQRVIAECKTERRVEWCWIRQGHSPAAKFDWAELRSSRSMLQPIRLRALKNVRIAWMRMSFSNES